MEESPVDQLQLSSSGGVAPAPLPGIGLPPANAGAMTPLTAYEIGLQNLKRALPSPSRENVLDVLVARDGIASRLQSNEPLTTPQIEKLATLDTDLRETAPLVDSALGAPTLRSWQRSMDPASERWWWALHEVAASTRVKLRPGTAILGTILLGISFAVTADTVGLLVKVAAISAGLVAILVQAALTVLTGSVLTSTGRKWVLTALARLGVEARFQDIKVAFLAIAVLLLSMLVRVMAPGWAADFYSGRGDTSSAREAWSDAIEDYKRAITLTPNNSDSHFRIALAYDRAQQSDRAIEEYKGVVASDSANAAAINNLARLYISRKQQYDALRLLDRLNQSFGGLSSEGRHQVFKNRGWAKLELGLYDEAAADLRAALRAQEGAAAHYLLGRVLEALKRPEEARKEFGAMIAIVQEQPQRELELEPEWVIYAQRYLLQGGEK